MCYTKSCTILPSKETSYTFLQNSNDNKYLKIQFKEIYNLYIRSKSTLSLS